MKCYYARPMNLYGSETEKRDIALLRALGLEVVDPNTKELSEKYHLEGMAAFYEFVDTVDVVIFRACPDGRITAGVMGEIQHALMRGKLILEIPGGFTRRAMSVVQTYEYLQEVGQR